MFQLRPYQAEARDAILAEWESGHRKTLLVLPTGCHAKGEKVLLADGHTKKVEDISAVDKLLGSDGSVRNILALHHGESRLYRIVPIKGEPFVVTEDHTLTLVRTTQYAAPKFPCQMRSGEIVDVKVSE